MQGLLREIEERFEAKVKQEEERLVYTKGKALQQQRDFDRGKEELVAQ